MDLLAASDLLDNILVALVAVAATGLGTLIGRLWGNVGKAHKRDKVLNQTQEATIQELTWAVAGKPADQWGPRRVGLVEQVTVLSDRMLAMNERMDRHEKWHDKFEDSALKPESSKPS